MGSERDLDPTNGLGLCLGFGTHRYSLDPSMDAAVSRGSKPTRSWGLTGKAQTPKQILGVTGALNPTVVWDPQADLAPGKWS